jgi:hypothetical protein
MASDEDILLSTRRRRPPRVGDVAGIGCVALAGRLDVRPVRHRRRLWRLVVPPSVLLAWVVLGSIGGMVLGLAARVFIAGALFQFVRREVSADQPVRWWRRVFSDELRGGRRAPTTQTLTVTATWGRTSDRRGPGRGVEGSGGGVDDEGDIARPRALRRLEILR